MNEELKKKSSLKISLLFEGQAVQSRDRPVREASPEGLIIESIPLAGLKPGYYSLTADLVFGGQLRDSRRAELEISPLASLPAPILVSRAVLTEADELLATGIQLLNSGKIQEASERLNRAYYLKPGPVAALALSEALFRKGEFQRVIELLGPYDQPEAPAEPGLLLGRAFHS